MAKSEFYTLNAIKQYKADYNVIYGERSNGKTTAVLLEGLERHVKSGYVSQLGIIRRWEEDFKGKNGKNLYDGIVKIGKIEELTKGEYNSVYYFSLRWYLCKYDDDGKKIKQANEPFAQGFAISSQEHYKSTSYPNIDIILFDEYITRKYYLPDEFIEFQNLLSTIIRLRDDVVIYMCGNTVNKYCPYYTEMGLTGIKKQKQGTIDVYTYGESGLVVAVEYSDFPAKKKPSNKYFAFNNPRLQMITNGGWEMDIHPHLPQKYKPKDVIYIFYVIFDGDIIQGNIITIDDKQFIYFHRKTTPIEEKTTRLIYTQSPDYRRNYRVSILHPYGKPDSKIADLIDRQKVFYQDNEIGEIMCNYYKWCSQNG